jgi:hypothetical protein
MQIKIFVWRINNNEKQNKGIKRFLHNLDHTEFVTAWKCNNWVCVDTVDV